LRSMTMTMTKAFAGARLAGLPVLLFALVLSTSGLAQDDGITADVNATESVTKPSGRFSSLSEAQKALREDLLKDYDRGSMPPFVLPEGGVAKNESEPTTVQVGINFHRVLDVNVVQSEIDLLTWMRFIWTDRRLSWDPAEYNGLDKIWFWVEAGAGMSETSEIWTPDIELWNQKDSIKTSFSDTFAAVDPDGKVFWSRPGHLVPVCKFAGLENFPFDNLACVIELGSWSYSGKFLRLEPFDGTGFSVGGSDTSGEAFSEFRLDNVTAELIIYPPYPSDPLADWPVLLYTISFHRSWQPYIRGYLISQIIFNLIGFACFWLPVQSGERLGLAITAMLSAVAADLVVVSKLPSAAELTWMQKFSLVSQIFAAFSVLEGVVVSYFFFQTADNLVPTYLQYIFIRAEGRRMRRQSSGVSATSANSRVQMIQNPLGDSMESDPASIRSFSMRPRDADDFKDRQEARSNARWKVWAQNIDNASRVIVPVLYVVIVSIFLAQVADHAEGN